MSNVAYANRGMKLEALIDYANQQYAANGIALIQKVATPWKVVRKGNQIVSAYPEKKSTVDFIGVYKGKAIAFDVKQTENKTRFPLANIEHHQVSFMREWQNRGGIAFVLIEFCAYGEVWLAAIDELIAYSHMNNRTSIAHDDMVVVASRVAQGNGIVLDYLKPVEVSG